MLTRIPRIRNIYEDPANAKHRRVIEAGMQVQQPIIERIITNGMHGNLDDKQSLRNCIALFEKVRKLSKLPVKPDWDFVEFTYRVAIEFDGIPREVKIAHGIPNEYTIPASGSNALFSFKNPSTLNIGRLIKRARREIEFIPLLKALNEMKVAILDAERKLAIQGLNDRENYIAEATKKEREELANRGITEVQVEGSTLTYVLTTTRIAMPHFDDYVMDKGPYIDSLVGAMAKRLSFGFNPKIAQLSKLSYSQ